MRKLITGAFMISASLAGLVSIAAAILLAIGLIDSFASPGSFLHLLISSGSKWGGREIAMVWLARLLSLLTIVVFGIGGATIYYLVGRKILMLLRLWDEG